MKRSFLTALDEMTTDSDRSAWVYMGDSADLSFPAKDFAGYVNALRDRETKISGEGWVCDTTYWAVSNGEVTGRIAIRHELNDFLRKVGGHVGYIVRPSCRQQGVATEMLRQLLLTDRAKSIGKILLTCDEGNLASEKTIVRNGGVLEGVTDVGPDRPRKKRFWISLA